MRLDAGRQAAFARSASDRYDRGERAFKPVITDAIGQYLALLRDDLAAQPVNGGPISRLVAAAPLPVPAPFTQSDADRIYTLMISDPERWHPILDGVIMPAYSAMLGPITAAALADPTTANAVQAWRSQWLTDRRQILVHIPDAITAQLRTALDGLAARQGTSVDDAQFEVEKMLDAGYQSWAGRAELIARTETVAANNQGALASWSALADAAQVTATKTWLATPDGRTRPEHAAANGQTVGINDSFTVGGELITGPGDGSAANVCNCRCTLTFDIPSDAPPAVAEQAAELEEQLVAAGSGAPSPVIYFLDGFALDAPGDTAPVAADVQDTPKGVAIMAMLSAADAAKLAQPGGEAPEDLHCTLGYLAKDAIEYSDDVKASLAEALASAWTGPVSAKAFATAVFNAADAEREPCSVLLVQSDELAAAHQGVSDAIGGLASDTFPIWIPHVSLRYGLSSGGASGASRTADAGSGLQASSGVPTGRRVSDLAAHAQQSAADDHRAGAGSGDGVAGDRGGRSGPRGDGQRGRAPSLSDAPLSAASPSARAGKSSASGGTRPVAAPADVLDASGAVRPDRRAGLGLLPAVPDGRLDSLSAAASGPAGGVSVERSRQAFAEAGSGPVSSDTGVSGEGGSTATSQALAADLVDLIGMQGAALTFDRLVMAWGAEQIDLTEQSLTAATEAPVTTPAAPPAPPADAPANDGAAPGGDTAAPPAIDLTPIGQTWSGPLAELDVPSSDHRRIKAGGGTIRPLPLPLSWQKSSDDEHDGSVIVGRILAVEDRGDVLWGSGDYMDPMLNFDAEQAMAQVDAGMGMISVDLVPTAVGFADADGNPIDPALYDGDGDVDLVAVEWEFCGATVVSVQAFANARIANDPAPEVQPSDVADIGMPMPEKFAGATPEGPTLAEDGASILLQDGSTVTVGDTVGLGDTDGDGDDDTGTITAIDSEGQAVDVTVLPDGDDDADDDPNNPVKISVPISTLVPPPSTPTNKPGTAETPPPPAAMAAQFADEPVSDKPWSDFPESAFNPDQWKRACIIHLDPASGQDPNSKDLHKLPIREPDGTLNRNAVHAAAGRVGSTDAPPDKIASAKASLRGAYNTLGEDVPDSIKAAAESVDEDYALLASSYSEPYRAEFFRKQTLDGPTALRVDRDTGQVSGHLGAFNTCHVAKLAETGMCVTVPEGDDFSLFHLGEVITEDGPIQVGKITVGGGHYGAGGVRGAVEHYDSTSSIAAPVRAYYDEYGIQVAGQLAHGIDAHKVDELMTAGQLSGDWRGRDPHRKLVAALAVNQGSFPVKRISPIVGLDANGEQISLVAAGVVYPPEPDTDVALPSGARIPRGDFETLVASMVEAMDRGKGILVDGPVDELALRRAKARLRLHSLSAAQ
jgi:hypothetical protein